MAISTPAATHYEMVKQSLLEGKAEVNKINDVPHVR